MKITSHQENILKSRLWLKPDWLIKIYCWLITSTNYFEEDGGFSASRLSTSIDQIQQRTSFYRHNRKTVLTAEQIKKALTFLKDEGIIEFSIEGEEVKIQLLKMYPLG